ncbi:MAG: hypothetical protein ACLTDR_15025 [Adlercreutzia equolifaciens]
MHQATTTRQRPRAATGRRRRDRCVVGLAPKLHRQDAPATSSDTFSTTDMLNASNHWMQRVPRFVGRREHEGRLHNRIPPARVGYDKALTYQDCEPRTTAACSALARPGDLIPTRPITAARSSRASGSCEPCHEHRRQPRATTSYGAVGRLHDEPALGITEHQAAKAKLTGWVDSQTFSFINGMTQDATPSQ